MKWIVVLCLFASVPTLAQAIRHNAKYRTLAWVALGFLAIEQTPLDLNFALVTWAGQWPGYVSGMEVALVDIVTLALAINLKGKGGGIPVMRFFALYFVAVVTSACLAAVPMASFFYVWQLLRVIFVYYVVARYCRDTEVVFCLLKGMALGLLYNVALAAWQRFGLGVLQTNGGFGHQNIFGMMTHFVVLPYFALLLTDTKKFLPWAVTLLGAFAAILTTSRGTLAMTFAGFAAIYLISLVRQYSPAKLRVAGMGLLAGIVLVPLFVSSFEARLGNDIGESFLTVDEERNQLNIIAANMLSDHPMGVGPNHYVVTALSGGYNERSSLSWTSYKAVVHNVYRLVAAETGYLGIIGYVIMIAQPTIAAFVWARRTRDVRGDLLLGIGVALLTVYSRSFFEWVFIMKEGQYMFAFAAAMIVGLARSLSEGRHSAHEPPFAFDVRPAPQTLGPR
uniref:O-antigen ligase-related domain-containing protein n=1 Tax=Rhodopseudomonas palustris (strain BisA53) TaxID=316055 RepID=Q07SM4_RHOP5